MTLNKAGEAVYPGLTNQGSATMGRREAISPNGKCHYKYNFTTNTKYPQFDILGPIEDIIFQSCVLPS